MELPRPSLVRTAAAVRIPTRLLTGTSSSRTFFAAALCTRCKQSGNFQAGLSLRVQLFRFVYIEVTTTLAGRRSRAQMPIPVYFILRVFWEYVLRVFSLALGVLSVQAY